MSEKAWRKIEVIQIGNRRGVKAWQTDPRPVLLSRHQVGLLMVPPVGLGNFLSPERFDEPGVQFIHGAKGSGKTSLLLAKRMLLEDAASERQLLCVPAQFPYVFSPFMDGNKIHFDSWESLAFSGADTWKFAWLLLLGAYILNAIDRSVERDRPTEASGQLLSSELVKALTGQRDVAGIKLDEKDWVSAFKYLIETSRKNPRESLKKLYDSEVLPHLNGTVSKRTAPVLVFVDGIDETFVGPGGSPLLKLAKSQQVDGLLGDDPRLSENSTAINSTDPTELARQIWVNAQTSLLAVATEFSIQSKGVVTLIGSMRSEAYGEATRRGTQAAGQRANFVKEIQYTRDHLEAIFRANIRADLRAQDLLKPMREDEIHAYLGRPTARHPQVAIEEQAFAYFCRHTFEEPRDLMLIGEKLSDLAEGRDNAAKVHTALCQTTDEILSDYIRFMDERWDKAFEAAVFPHIPKNVISLDEAQAVADSVKSEALIDEKHPLCYLYRRGLLGVISSAGTQSFQKIAHVEEGSRRHLPRSVAYLIHPVLDQRISKARIAASKERYRITKGVVVGDGMTWEAGMGSKRVHLVLKGASVSLEIDGVPLSSPKGPGFHHAGNINTAILVSCLLEMFHQETDRPSIDGIMLSIKTLIDSRILTPRLRRAGRLIDTMEYTKTMLEADRKPPAFETINKHLKEHNLVGIVISRSKITRTLGIDSLRWQDLDINQST